MVDSRVYKLSWILGPLGTKCLTPSVKVFKLLMISHLDWPYGRAGTRGKL